MNSSINISGFFTRDELFIQTMIMKIYSFEIDAKRIELGMKGEKDREICRYENLKWKIKRKWKKVFET